LPKPPLPKEVRGLLERANPAVICTLGKQGQPVSVPTWYLLDGERLLVSMDEGRRRLDYLRNDPRVSVTVLDEAGWHTHVSVQGRVVELRDDDDLADIDRLAQHYTGGLFAARDRKRVSAWVEIDRWHGWSGLGTISADPVSR
jgi:PPOX class probable F420-dependent enzyme